MKKLLVVMMLISLVGCATIKTPPVEANTVVKIQNVYITVPDELLIVPPQIPPLDLKVSKDREIADWMIDSEKRSLDIETKLKTIKRLQEKRTEQQDKTQAEAQP